ncbi:MAG: HD domain-containing protein [Negativicutes bacterium]|nr:HD domain-containing protein [Negativicutes bacterium]
MQKFSLARLVPGMVVARDVVGADGRVLIRRGVVLTERYIHRLGQMGIGSIFIRSPLDAELSCPEIIQEETKNRALKTVKQTFAKIQERSAVNAAEFAPIVQDILAELLHNRHTMLHMTDIRTYDDYTFGHSINVSIYAAFVGLAMGLKEHQLKELTLGAILHDIGKMAVPPEILNKPAKLAPDEMEIVKRHSAAGFELLRKNGEIPLLAAHVALQHQERFDGSGYPRGLKGGNIHPYGRIAAVADVYDALTSDRPYRRGMLPHEAYEYMLSVAGKDFDDQVLAMFFKRIALYPVGTMVRLNTGATGIVTGLTPELSLRPKVRLLLHPDGSVAQDKTEVDLTKLLTVFIAKVCTEEEVMAVYRKLGMNFNSSEQK